MRWPFARAAAAPVDRSRWTDDAGWQAAIAGRPYLERLDAADLGRLRALCGDFLATKAVNGAGGLEMTDAIVAGIAVQAALPILELGLDAYPRFDEIIVYPDDFVVDREIVDDDGVVHQWREAAAGESWDDGPVVLAWAAADRTAPGRPSPFAFNVVIHEFAHKLDMTNGAVDGIPGFAAKLHRGLDGERWRDVLHAVFDDFTARVDAVEAAIPRHVDPESARADRWYASLPLDAYAAHDEGEFFSVSSEAFFVAPERLRDAYPDWYALLVAYYRQDPLR